MIIYSYKKYNYQKKNISIKRVLSDLESYFDVKINYYINPSIIIKNISVVNQSLDEILQMIANRYGFVINKQEGLILIIDNNYKYTKKYKYYSMIENISKQMGLSFEIDNNKISVNGSYEEHKLIKNIEKYADNNKKSNWSLEFKAITIVSDLQNIDLLSRILETLEQSYIPSNLNQAKNFLSDTILNITSGVINKRKKNYLYCKNIIYKTNMIIDHEFQVNLQQPKSHINPSTVSYNLHNNSKHVIKDQNSHLDNILIKGTMNSDYKLNVRINNNSRILNINDNISSSVILEPNKNVFLGTATYEIFKNKNNSKKSWWNIISKEKPMLYRKYYLILSVRLKRL